VICFELYTYGKRKQVLWDTKFFLNQLFKEMDSGWIEISMDRLLTYYQLKNRNDSTLLKIEIDDFAQLLKMFKFIM
jgi:hypothetical protein